MTLLKSCGYEKFKCLKSARTESRCLIADQLENKTQKTERMLTTMENLEEYPKSFICSDF